MSVRSLVLAPAVAALVMAAPAIADQAKSVTATGVGTVKVVPKNRKSESSIEKAVDAARKAGIRGALRDAHEYARLYAQAASLTLGPVISVSDAQSQGFGVYASVGAPFYGPFGPNKYCGILRRPVVKVVNHKRKVVATKRVRRCFVPPFEATTLTVTYSAT
jgi:Protein of unknown function (DUF541)